MLTLLSSLIVHAAPAKTAKHAEKIYRSEHADSAFTERCSISQRLSVAGKETLFGAHEAKTEKGKETASTPVIVLNDGDKNRKVVFGDFAGFTWVKAASLNAYAWGILENGTEGPARTVNIAWTGDRGKTWKIASFAKPEMSAAVTDFGMNGKGRGFLLLRQGSEDSEKIQGLYIYETKDYGKTWKKSKFLQDLTDENVESDTSCVFGTMPTESIPEKCRVKKE